MQIIRLLPAALLFAACEAKKPPPPPPPPPPATIADFAGDWTGTNQFKGVADTIYSAIHGSASGLDWYMSLAGRDSIPLQVSTRGDSLILLSRKYKSILRKQTVVQVRSAVVLTDSGIVGKLIATYDSPSGQELLTGVVHAVRDTMP